VIQLEHVTLPQGLSALAHRDPRGNLVIYVSASLDASRQRAAVMQAIRATQRTGWRAGLPPVGIALILAARTVLRRAGAALRVRPVAWSAAATATVAGAATAGVLLTSPSHQAIPPAAAGPSLGPGAAAPSTPSSQPRPAHPGHRTRPGTASPRLVASGGSPGAAQPATSSQPTPAPGSAPAPAPTEPAPSTAPSPAPTEPAPSPSPSPTGGSGTCVTVLGITVCLPPLTVTVKA
jgi:hypothetical protein